MRLIAMHASARLAWLWTAVLGLAGACSAAKTRDASGGAVGGSALVAAPERREIEMAFYADRAARDPLGAADRSRLAALHLDRARESGSFADLERAEYFARESLRLRTAHNAGTLALLASILMAQHRFPEALRAAERADLLEPGVVSQRALIGEIALELGDYDRARAVFDSLRREPLTDVASLRLARWDELSGHLEWAARRMRRVAEEWKHLPDAPPQHLAWLDLRLAELALKEGRLSGADSALQTAFSHAPDDYRLLGAAARLAASRGRWRESIRYGERAIGISMEPMTLGILSDAYAAIHDSTRSAEYAAIMRSVALNQPAFPHRGWSLWLLDHDADVPAVLRRARDELELRQDVYGYDLYAWALHKSGRAREARDAMRLALRLGTQDPLLKRHAAAILQVLNEGAAQ